MSVPGPNPYPHSTPPPPGQYPQQQSYPYAPPPGYQPAPYPAVAPGPYPQQYPAPPPQGHYQPYPPQPPYPPQQAYPYPPGAGAYQPYGPAMSPSGEPLFSARFHTHTGLVIIGLSESVVVTGTLDECRRRYRQSMLHCLTLGWWGIISLFLYNPIAISQNVSAMRSVRRQAAALTPSSD